MWAMPRSFLRRVYAGRRRSAPIAVWGAKWKARFFTRQVNKHHAGFLGHSYVCPWANLGASLPIAI